MKFFLAWALTLTSFSSFALTKNQAIKLVRASRVESLSGLTTKSLSTNEIQVNYNIGIEKMCSTIVKEVKNEDDLKVITISEGYCYN